MALHLLALVDDLEAADIRLVWQHDKALARKPQGRSKVCEFAIIKQYVQLPELWRLAKILAN